MSRFQIIFGMLWRGLVWGIPVGALIGFCLGLPVFIIGGLIGFIWGGGVGARVGLTVGLVMSLVTLRWFAPLVDADSYLDLCRWLCPLVAGLAMFVWSNLTYGAGGIIYLALLPAIFAGVCAVPLSRWLSHWYVARAIPSPE